MCIAGLNEDGTPRFDIDKVNSEFGEKWYTMDAASKISAEEAGERFRRDATAAGIPCIEQQTTVEIVKTLETQTDVNALISSLVLEGGAWT
jgi:hypothetical protein